MITHYVVRKARTNVTRIHVFADLKPYICTFSSCPDELYTFPTRQLWADHELRKHRMEKSWFCCKCPHQLLSPSLWDNHIKDRHGFTFSNDQDRKKAIAVAESFSKIPVESQICPMCRKGGMKTNKELVAHVAKHMESIALAALPRDTDSDSEPGSDEASKPREEEKKLPFAQVTEKSQPIVSSEPNSFMSQIDGPPQNADSYQASGPSSFIVGPKTRVETKLYGYGDQESAEPPLSNVSFDRRNMPQTSSYWSVPEQTDFPALLQHFGTDWKAIAKWMGSKTHIMVNIPYSRNTFNCEITQIIAKFCM
jgi:hypothetical protein